MTHLDRNAGFGRKNKPTEETFLLDGNKNCKNYEISRKMWYN